MNTAGGKVKVCLCKEEILDTIKMILRTIEPYDSERPKMSERLQRDLRRIGGGQLPENIEAEVREHDDAMDKFLINMRKICKNSFRPEFKRLKDNNPGIVDMIIKYGKNTDFVRLNKMLDLYEKVQTKDVSNLKASYQIGRELRDEFVNQRIGVRQEDITELDPDSVDINKIQQEHPHIFK
jgi:hypothetical protein